MSADSVSDSSQFFGITTGLDSTGAPGGGSAGTLHPGPGETGAPKHAGTSQAQPQDLETISPSHNIDGSPVHHSLPENVFNYVDQSNLPHGGVEASQGKHVIPGTPYSNDTGAGNGSVTKPRA